MTTEPYHVRVDGVTVRFDSRVVLDQLSCAFGAGQMTAVMGPSGSGKSTLLAVLAGLLAPSSGRVIAETPENGNMDVAWIFQSSPVLTRRSALDNVALGPLSRGVPRSEAVSRAMSAMESLGITSYAATPAYRMSGGERQRIVVARAIATRAFMILADEPTASLDASNRSSVCEALLTAAQSGSAVILATHDTVVSSLCHQVVDLTAIGGVGL